MHTHAWLNSTMLRLSEHVQPAAGKKAVTLSHAGGGTGTASAGTSPRRRGVRAHLDGAGSRSLDRSVDFDSLRTAFFRHV